MRLDWKHEAHDHILTSLRVPVSIALTFASRLMVAVNKTGRDGASTFNQSMAHWLVLGTSGRWW